jgi:hypothetical protein
LLLRNPDLANAIDLANRWGDELDGTTRDFIKRSGRRARLVQTLTAAAALLFAVEALAAGGLRTEPIWLGNPFRGLESYEFEHAPIFFGRDAPVMKATEQLAINARSGSAFLLVSGASGSGKSSLDPRDVISSLLANRLTIYNRRGFPWRTSLRLRRWWRRS